MCRYIFHKILSWCKFLYYLIETGQQGLESCSLLKSDMILWKKIHFVHLQSTNELIRRSCLPQRKLHGLLGILQKRKKEICMEHFDEVKNNPTYSTHTAIVAKHAYGKVWNFFLILLHFSREKLFIILLTSLKFPVGQSRKFLISTLPYIFDSLFWQLKKFRMQFWRVNYREIKLLTLVQTYFLCWVVKTAGVANHYRDADRSFTMAVNNPRLYVSQWKLH